MKAISVIIPVYNLRKRLRECLDSLARQTFRDFEVIIVDDGSTDGSANLAREILTGHGLDFTVLVQERNGGVSAARNRGIRASKSKYVICVVDGDDWVEPNFLEALYNAAEASGADYAACGYREFYADNRTEKFHRLSVAEKSSPDLILEGRLRNTIEIYHWTTLFHRKFLLNHALIYEENCFDGEDMEFVLKVLCHRPSGVFIPDCLYIYVQHNDMSTSRQQPKERRIKRLISYMEMQFRAAHYIKEHCGDNKVLCGLADHFLLAQACHKKLKAYAMLGDKTAFMDIIHSREVRRILFNSWRSLKIDPDLFPKSCFALFLPETYYRRYRHYFS